MGQHEVWRQFATAGLNALLINRQLPMRLDEDFEFIKSASDVVAKFADCMTECWLARQPNRRKRGSE